jgi:hypothetical protein
MADSIDLQTIANDAAFRGRCMYYLTQQAMALMTGASAPAPQIVTYANLVTSGAINAYLIALVVLTNPTIAAEATVSSLPGCTAVLDGDIQFAVVSYFNALAGIPTA